MLQAKGVKKHQNPWTCVSTCTYLYIFKRPPSFGAWQVAPQLHLSILFHSHMVVDKSSKGSVIQEMPCWSATRQRKISGYRIRCSCPRLLFSLSLKYHGQPASTPWTTHNYQSVSAHHEVHRRGAWASSTWYPELTLRPWWAWQWQRKLR